MNTIKSDPLLAIARIVLTVTLAIIGIAAVTIAIALPALGLLHGRVTAELLAEGAPVETFWAIVVLLVLVLGILAMTFLFFRHLRRIVLTVAHGDPFVPVNASRLVAMAWLSLGVWVMGIPTQAIGNWIEAVTEDSDVQIAFGDAGGMSLALVLTLFILARVFRKGAEMREELEGTV